MTDSKKKLKESSEVRIAVIDDDQDVVSIIEKTLNGKGYKTLGITECLGSSGKLNKFKPQIIIVDIMMPALDGPGLLEVYQNTLDARPWVILYSGIDPEELERLAREVQADDFVYKGDGIFRLLGRVNLHVQEMKMQQKLNQKQ